VSQATETRKELRLRRPCHIDKQKLLGLVNLLHEHHKRVQLSLSTDRGADREGLVTVERLLERNIAPKWEHIHVVCDEPRLDIHLRDVPYQEVQLVWMGDAANDSAKNAHQLMKTWMRLRQGPSHFLAFVAMMVILFVGVEWASPWRGGQEPAEPIAEKTTRTLEEYREELVRRYGAEEAAQILEREKLQALQLAEARKEAGDHETPTDNDSDGLLGYLLSLGLFGVLSVLVGLAIGRSISFIAPLYYRVFPAFYFDFDSCSYFYWTKNATWIGLVLATSLITRIVTKLT
jgi:hypothetical protein